MKMPSLEVLFEDNHLIVVNKPPGIPTMGVASGERSMVTLVRSYLKQKYSKPGNVYLGVVSRLDSASRGVLVFARTSKAASRLTAQFRHGEVRKTYLAIVVGEVAAREGSLVDWLVKDEQARRMRLATAEEKSSELPGVQRAELEWKCLGIFAGQSLLEIDLKTGRKHQIRVQWAAQGHPIVGDRKYGRGGDFEGIALLARSLVLDHPVRRTPLVVTAPVPDSWKIRRFRQK